MTNYCRIKSLVSATLVFTSKKYPHWVGTMTRKKSKWGDINIKAHGSQKKNNLEAQKIEDNISQVHKKDRHEIG